jgi:hypothetical protein
VRIHLRADSGFGTPAMYAACERWEIQYTIGIGMNACHCQADLYNLNG